MLTLVLFILLIFVIVTQLCISWMCFRLPKRIQAEAESSAIVPSSAAMRHSAMHHSPPSTIRPRQKLFCEGSWKSRLPFLCMLLKRVYVVKHVFKFGNVKVNLWKIGEVSYACDLSFDVWHVNLILFIIQSFNIKLKIDQNWIIALHCIEQIWRHLLKVIRNYSFRGKSRSAVRQKSTKCFLRLMLSFTLSYLPV